MRWRLIVLGLLGVAMALTAIVCVVQSANFMIAAQNIYVTAGATQPVDEQMKRASELYQTSATLQLVVAPLLTGAVLCLVAVLIVFARRWQLRAQAAGTRTISDAGST